MTLGLVIRAAEPGDAEALAFLLNLPGFRHGTMRLPFETVDTVRGRLSRSKSAGGHIVAVIDGTIVGSASLDVGEGRRRHVGSIGLGVHDAYTRRGIGTSLLEALLDVADNWLDLRRVQLDVFTDNAVAITLYERHGFAREGVKRCDGFRDGAHVDSLMMARLKPGFP